MSSDTARIYAKPVRRKELRIMKKKVARVRKSMNKLKRLRRNLRVAEGQNNLSVARSIKQQMLETLVETNHLLNEIEGM